MDIFERTAAEYAARYLTTRTGEINAASLERTDNYRGEYPHMGPRPEGATEGTVEDGGDYALTNKLDYVFFKRPMERKPSKEPEP